MEISFIASLPDIQSAILISGDGATRLKLDIPESELPEAIKLVMLKGTAFRVSINDQITIKHREKREEDKPKLSQKPKAVQKGRGQKPKRQAN